MRDAAPAIATVLGLPHRTESQWAQVCVARCMRETRLRIRA
jgi:hypothetical protein